MGCEEDVAKIGKKLENMVANGTTVSLLHKITNKQNKNGSWCLQAVQPGPWTVTLDLVYYRLGWWLFTGIGADAPSVDVGRCRYAALLLCRIRTRPVFQIFCNSKNVIMCRTLDLKNIGASVGTSESARRRCIICPE